ncbi:MAG: MFS transporter [Firmicutes bacterium]|nr:MFS transporter [Bacillota bacterium]
MKLNYKRTLLVGFAFFLICVFWQAYDTLVPLMLTNKFGMDQTWSGLIMSLDNILALFMLPIFGALSDKTKTRFGKRTPYIVIGTICAIVCFVGLTFVDNAQLSKLTDGNTELYWSQNYTIENKEYQSVTNNGVPSTYALQDYAAKMYYNKTYDELSPEQKTRLEAWYTNKQTMPTDEAELNELVKIYYGSNDGRTYAELGQGERDALTEWRTKQVNYDLFYTYSRAENVETYRLYLKNANGEYLVINDADGYDVVSSSEIDGRLSNAYSSVVSSAESQFAKSVSANNVYLMVIFIIVLLLTLISMATFRSPAVALMPDVTLKPLRSKANAIINLMGTAGGIVVLGLGMLFNTGAVRNQMMSYTIFVSAVCGIMAIALVVFIFTVKERKWNEEMLAGQAVLDEDEKSETEATQETTAEASGEESVTAAADKKKDKLPKDKLVSLILILASVALWYIGYNAITSKYSVYALNELNKDYNATLMIAQVAAVIAYIPVGIIASKIGRKKTILIGVAMLTVAFGGAIFIKSSSPNWLMWILFALAGIAWATINVNSFPMVVELAQGNDIGKYTGYYYTASMAAQVVTPILSGALMDAFGTMRILFPYATIFVALAFVTMFFVKHGDAKPEQPQSKLEMLAGGDD